MPDLKKGAAQTRESGLAQPGYATAQVLRDLWSRAVHRPSSPWNPPSAYERNNIKVAMENNLHRSLRTAAKGSGAGLTGWRFEYLAPLLRASGQEWEPFENLACGLSIFKWSNSKLLGLTYVVIRIVGLKMEQFVPNVSHA